MKKTTMTEPRELQAKSISAQEYAHQQIDALTLKHERLRRALFAVLLKDYDGNIANLLYAITTYNKLLAENRESVNACVEGRRIAVQTYYAQQEAARKQAKRKTKRPAVVA